MDIGPPPPPPLFFATPQADVSNSNHSSSPSSPSPISSIVILIIILSSVIIVSATVYLLTRFFSRRRHVTFRTTFSPSDDVVYNNRNRNENEHVITVGNDGVESLPLFTFSSLTGNITGGDCAVCLSKFEGADQLRLLPLCCHAFHVECIDSWLKSNMTCPLCRSTVNPSEADIMNKISASGNTSNSFRIEIGTVSQRRDPSESDRISYSIGSFEYVLDDGYEISVESTHRPAVVDKDSVNPEPPVQNSAAEIGGGGDGDGGGSRNWLRDYVDRVSVSLSSRTLSFRGSGRFFTGSSSRSEDFEATNSRIGEEISEFFRWFSGV